MKRASAFTIPSSTTPTSGAARSLRLSTFEDCLVADYPLVVGLWRSCSASELS